MLKLSNKEIRILKTLLVDRMFYLEDERKECVSKTHKEELRKDFVDVCTIKSKLDNEVSDRIETMINKGKKK